MSLRPDCGCASLSCFCRRHSFGNVLSASNLMLRSYQRVCSSMEIINQASALALPQGYKGQKKPMSCVHPSALWSGAHGHSSLPQQPAT